jgi:hypothetical protein
VLFCFADCGVNTQAQGRGLQTLFIVAASHADLHADVIAGISAVQAGGASPDNRRVSISDCD